MIDIRLDDPNLGQNLKAILELKKTGMFSEEDIQKMYDKQIEKDKETINE